jgi:hypothetical protein
MELCFFYLVLTIEGCSRGVTVIGLKLSQGVEPLHDELLIETNAVQLIRSHIVLNYVGNSSMI